MGYGILTTANTTEKKGFRDSAVWRGLTSDTGARITAGLTFLILWLIVALSITRVPTPAATFYSIWLEIGGWNHGGSLNGEFWEHFSVTVVRFTAGLILGIGAGVVVGIMVGTFSFARSFLSDVLLVFLALPAIIWAFLTVMWFGLGWQAPVYTVMLSSMPFVAVNIAHGVRAVSPEMYQMSDAFGVPKTRQFRSLLMPAVAGYLFTGLRFAFIIGWNAVLLAEWFGSGNGVGWRARLWYDAARYKGFVGWVIIFIIFIFIVDGLILTPMQKRAFRWRRSAKVDARLEVDDDETDDLAVAAL
ncbi:MAG: ABC transporter permease [Acidimicrobiia bacterium]